MLTTLKKDNIRAVCVFHFYIRPLEKNKKKNKELLDRHYFFSLKSLLPYSIMSLVVFNAIRNVLILVQPLIKLHHRTRYTHTYVRRRR